MTWVEVQRTPPEGSREHQEGVRAFLTRVKGSERAPGDQSHSWTPVTMRDEPSGVGRDSNLPASPGQLCILLEGFRSEEGLWGPRDNSSREARSTPK